MLSRSIGKMAEALEDELSNGAVITPDMQRTMVEIMRDWQRLAGILEEETRVKRLKSRPAFRPVIVAGTDLEAPTQAKEMIND